jgi:RNA polymerase sigma-70 factor (ECF subfamily)
LQEQIKKALLDRALEGNTEACEELFELCLPHIYRYILSRVRDQQLAEDLTGEVFLKVHQSIEKGTAWNYTFTSWLYRIARNQIIDYQRRDSKFTFKSIDQHEYLPSEQPDPLASAQGCLEAESLRAAIARLPDTQAEVISLRFLEQYSVREVAKILNRTELSVRALQFRGIKVLRESMAREIG